MNTNDKLRELIRSPLSTAVEVTQADRDAAKPFMDRFLDGSSFADDREELALAFARHRQASIAQHEGGRGEPVAYRYVHRDYAGRKVSRYGTHAERVNGHDPIEIHPLYAHPPATRPAAPSDRNAVLEAVHAVAKIEMDREGYPLSRSQEEIYADAGETVDAVLAALRTTEAPAQGGE